MFYRIASLVSAPLLHSKKKPEGEPTRALLPVLYFSALLYRPFTALRFMRLFYRNFVRRIHSVGRSSGIGQHHYFPGETALTETKIQIVFPFRERRQFPAQLNRFQTFRNRGQLRGYSRKRRSGEFDLSPRYRPLRRRSVRSAGSSFCICGRNWESGDPYSVSTLQCWNAGVSYGWACFNARMTAPILSSGQTSSIFHSVTCSTMPVFPR